MEKYIIDTDTKRADWEIIKEGYDREGGKAPRDPIFPIEDIDKAGNILRVFDTWVLDKYFNKAKKKKRFKEVAEFTVIIDGKKVGKFTGTFIDALEKIKKYFEGYKDERSFEI